MRSGLYRYIRHPTYLGEILVLMAWPFEYGAPLTEVLVLVIGAIAIRQRIRYEEAELMALYGDDYAQYVGETDRILPTCGEPTRLLSRPQFTGLSCVARSPSVHRRKSSSRCSGSASIEVDGFPTISF